MTIREISSKWYKLETEGLVFFGYSKGHVIQKYRAWVREYDLSKMRRPHERDLENTEQH